MQFSGCFFSKLADTLCYRTSYRVSSITVREQQSSLLCWLPGILYLTTELKAKVGDTRGLFQSQKWRLAFLIRSYCQGGWASSQMFVFRKWRFSHPQVIGYWTREKESNKQKSNPSYLFAELFIDCCCVVSMLCTWLYDEDMTDVQSNPVWSCYKKCNSLLNVRLQLLRRYRN